MAFKLSVEFMMFVGIVVLALFICYDLYKAYRRGAKWIPGNFLIFCGLSVQLLGYLDIQHVGSASRHKEHELGVLIAKQLSIDSSRLVLFVFVGYLLPGLASAGRLWSNIGALSISLSSHIAMELLAVQTNSSEKDKVVNGQSGVWLIASDYVLLYSMFGLLFFLVWAIGSGRFIRDNLSSRIHLVLSGSDNNKASSWETFETEILKSWIVARVCQPEYVLSRTPFSAGVGIVLTDCVVVFSAKVICLRSQLHRAIPLFTLQFIFIIVGWFAVMYRWYSGVLYFKHGQVLNNIRLGVFPTLWNLTILVIVNRLRSVSILVWIPTAILYLILYLFVVLILLGFVVAYHGYIIICTLFWWLSGQILGNKFVERLCRVQTKPREDDKEFSKYEPALKRLCGPGEDAASLWVANETSFKEIKAEITKGYDRGTRCRELIEVIASKLGGNYIEREEQLPEPLKQLLEHLESVKEYFPLLENSFRGVIAHSLLFIMEELNRVKDQIFLSDEDQKMIKKAKTAYDKVKELIDLVDCPDNVGINVDVLSAKNVEAFQMRTTVGQYKKTKLVVLEGSLPVDFVLRFIEEMQKGAGEELKRCKLLGEALDAGALNTDWASAANHYGMYKVCKTIRDRNPPNTPKELSLLVGELYNLFVEVIASCVRDAPEILLSSTKRWAEDFKENKIAAAIDIAGFAWGVIDEANKSNEALPSTTDADTAVVNLE